MIVSIIGLGYIGLPTAALIASKGIKTIGVDKNIEIVELINKGKCPIVEKDLDKLLSKTIKQKNLFVTSIPKKSDVFIIAVPTPLNNKNNSPDISQVEESVENISTLLMPGNIVILESTIPVGATEKVADIIRKKRPDLNLPDFGSKSLNYSVNIAHCPERVLPGNILYELLNNDRIIGGISDQCSKKAKSIYELFVKGDCKITDSRTAELCKLAENSYRDVNIAFANELSMICEKLEINPWNLIELANNHPRVDILKPGPGVGGHCIAVDPWFIVHSNEKEAKLIKTARQVNLNKTEFIISKIHNEVSMLPKPINEINIACLGLAFKANVDDLRESPALEIAIKLNKFNFQKQFLIEPNISKIPKNFKNNAILSSLNEILEEVDIVLILVDHEEFKNINIDKLKNKIIIDTRGLLNNLI